MGDMGPGMRRCGSVLLAVLLAVAAGCGGDDDGSESDSRSESDDPTTTTGQATTTTLSEEDEAIAAVQRAFQAIDAAYDPPNPDHPDLSGTYAGEALNGLRQTILLYQGRGESQIGEILEESYEVVDLVGDSASVRSCTREQFQDIDTVTREPKGEQQEQVVHAVQHLERVEATWKIVSVEFLEEPCTFD